MSKTTTIEVDEWVRDLLKEVGKKGESYEDVIIRLMKENNPKVYRKWKRFEKKAKSS